MRDGIVSDWRTYDVSNAPVQFDRLSTFATYVLVQYWDG